MNLDLCGFGRVMSRNLDPCRSVPHPTRPGQVLSPKSEYATKGDESLNVTSLWRCLIA